VVHLLTTDRAAYLAAKSGIVEELLARARAIT
jgi:hypothetical protein